MDADKLIHQIDSELLKLDEASKKDEKDRKHLTFSHFDFRGALSMFRDEMDKHGWNDYYKKRMAEYVNVFTDLCNTCNELLPESKTAVCKYYSLLKGYEFSFEKVQGDVYRTLTKGERFNDFLDDFNLAIKHYITFEEYIIKIRRERQIASNASNRSSDHIKTRTELDTTISKGWVNINERELLSELFEINQTTAPINWQGTYDNLVESVNRWHKDQLIKLYGNLNLKTFILKNFRSKGKNINDRTLANTISQMNSPK